ncbi:hypothetical protein DH2020_036610 [Rehmannia glutinosa]|uniref:Uncharacterized protein n=1 Tax=Rehmannia glutinosa TaxID=99300 RepID=A0ABR0V3P4_REHGL
MLQMIKISQGKATFCSRYVKTHKHAVEREIGYPFVPGVFSSFNGLPATMARLALSAARVLTGQFDPASHGSGSANARLAVFGGRLFALCESDLPYEVKVTGDGDIITLGRHDLHTSEPFLRMTAHPKIDRVTGEAFFYGYDVARPYLTFYRTDGGGRKQKGMPIFSMEECTAIHDFAVTKNYAVFPDVQIVVRPAWVLRGDRRYIYAAIIDQTSWAGLVKLDLSLTNVDGGDCTVATRLYGLGYSGGEPFFVPREPNNPTVDEDDGYLVTYVHDKNTDESKFLVMDAKSPTLDIVAAVKLHNGFPMVSMASFCRRAISENFENYLSIIN